MKTFEKLFQKLDNNRLKKIGNLTLDLEVGNIETTKPHPIGSSVYGSVVRDERDGSVTLKLTEDHGDRNTQTTVIVTPGEFEKDVPEVKALQCKYQEGTDPEIASYPPAEGLAELSLGALRAVISLAHTVQHETILTVTSNTQPAV
jgi:hypothetical protein